MPTCTCPSDRRTIASGDRVYLYEPGALRREGGQVVKDKNKIHIFHRDCPLHGYTVIEAKEHIDDDT